MCIYSLFIGADLCSICLSTATVYPTHQFTRHSPWISGHHRPWLQSLTAHQTLMPILPLSFIRCFLLKCIPNPLICVTESCSFFHHPVCIISFFYRLPFSPLTHFLGVSLHSSKTLRPLLPLGGSLQKRQKNTQTLLSSVLLVMCVLF